ncbi:MAG: trehalose-6-phosphate synthase [Planctomycetota bacterium]
MAGLMRMVVVSNRLPVVLEREGETWQVRPGSGGLVTALSPLLRQRGGLWIGWPGVRADESAGVESHLAEYSGAAGFEVVPVALTAEDVGGFYHGFSNEIIWPLFHDLQTRCNFVPEYWTTYRAVQGKFAEVVRQQARERDFIWVHDYHLMGLGRQLRRREALNRIGFFLHTPFPPPDIFLKLPWRAEVLEELLDYDVLGFQTPRDRDNFAACVRHLLPRARLRRKRGVIRVQQPGRSVHVDALPIGIDHAEFAARAAAPSVTARVRELRAQIADQQIVLSVDRLDYTKGIPYRLKAFRTALERYPDLHRQVTLFQLVVPSREAVPEYQDSRAEVEQLVGQVNGQFTEPGWIPIHHVFRPVERDELLALYRTADVGLVTPLKDGMNLVAKEYCACQVEGDGVLILSEFAGAAVQLGRHALLVNPYDLDGVAAALHQAVRTPRAARHAAMRHLRTNIRRYDVHWWAEQFLKASGLAVAATPAGPGLPTKHALPVTPTGAVPQDFEACTS